MKRKYPTFDHRDTAGNLHPDALKPIRELLGLPWNVGLETTLSGMEGTPEALEALRLLSKIRHGNILAARIDNCAVSFLVKG